MPEENQEQQPEQAQEPVQEQEQAQEPAEQQQEDKPVKEEKKDGGLLLPVLYALLAAVGAFTLIMIAGIVMTLLTQPAQPSETPSAEPSSRTAPTPARAGLSPDAAPADITVFFHC